MFGTVPKLDNRTMAGSSSSRDVKDWRWELQHLYLMRYMDPISDTLLCNKKNRVTLSTQATGEDFAKHLLYSEVREIASAILFLCHQEGNVTDYGFFV